MHSMETDINPAIQSGNFTVDPVPADQLKPISYNDLLNIDNALNQSYGNTSLGGGLVNSWNDFFASNYLLTSIPTPQIPYVPGYNPADPYGFGPSLAPIGAFYETVTPALDLAPSITDKTPVLLGANNQSLSVTSLASRDTNYDGLLSGAELTGINAWADANENGTLETGELRSLTTAGITQIKSADYRFYTQGNSRFADGASAAAPDSNYRTLRDTDNTYIWASGGYIGVINWTPGQIKINFNNKSTLIGTDGNDNFDASYWAQYPQYFNVSLLTNFLGGGGDDTVGGSSRNDMIWGGTGNDLLGKMRAANDAVFEMRRAG